MTEKERSVLNYILGRLEGIAEMLGDSDLQEKLLDIAELLNGVLSGGVNE